MTGLNPGDMCSVEYTVTDGNGLSATNTITWTVLDAPVSNFFLDGDPNEEDIGAMAKAETFLAVSDGAGNATGYIGTPPAGFNAGGLTVYADFEEFAAATNKTIVDPVNCTYTNDDGTAANTPLCLPELTYGHLGPISISLYDSMTDNNDGTIDLEWDEGFVSTFTFNTTSGTDWTTGILVSTAGGFTGTVSNEMTTVPSVGGGVCEDEYQEKFSLRDFDNPGTITMITSRGDVSVAPANGMVETSSGVFEKTTNDANGTVAFGSITPNFGAPFGTNAPVGPHPPTQPGPFEFSVDSNDPIAFRSDIVRRRAVECVEICGVLVSGVDSDGNTLTAAQLGQVEKK